MKKEDCYLLGKITRRHGLAGNVVLKLDTDQPELYNKLDNILVEINGLLVPFFIEKQQWSKEDTKLIFFKNSTEAMVDQAVGRNVFLPLSTLPVLSGKSFYYHEIIGFRLLDENNTDFGIIQSVNDQTAQHYFVTLLHGKQIIVPIIKDWILDVNREQKEIKMQLPEGLMDVFTQPAIKDE